MNDANIRNLIAPQENQGFRCERTSDWGPASSATFLFQAKQISRRYPVLLLVAQRFIYRQLMYSVVIRAMINAMRGRVGVSA